MPRGVCYNCAEAGGTLTSWHDGDLWENHTDCHADMKHRALGTGRFTIEGGGAQ